MNKNGNKTFQVASYFGETGHGNEKGDRSSEDNDHTNQEKYKSSTMGNMPLSSISESIRMEKLQYRTCILMSV